MQIKELVTFDEMFFQFEIITQLYPDISKEKYQNYLQDMIPHNYKQLAVFEGDKCVALTGFWFGTKLWSGKYIEIDNFIVHKDHRMKGLGKIMTDYINQKAQDLGLNRSAHKLNSASPIAASTTRLNQKSPRLAPRNTSARSSSM